VDQLVEHGQAVIERGSKSFAAAARLFDPGTRASAYMLYAWCRHCDDQTDDQELGFNASQLPRAEARARVDRLRRATHHALTADVIEDPVYAGLRRVVDRHHIPERYLMQHLDGFAMDVEGRTYRNLDDTLEYCYHVAGVVGIMMAYIMGVRDEPTLDRAADLGLAFQLTNICRDVMDDAEIGRVYLPADWLEGAGIPIDQIRLADHRERVFAVVRRILAEADRYYASSWVGIARLPFRSAWAVAAANAVYRDIGRLILELGPSAWEGRSSTGKMRKALLAAGAGLRTMASRVVHRGLETRPREGLWMRPKTEAP
jgi:phytoene synthase